MLYGQSAEPFSAERFRNPGACYRAAPFWAWNTRMTRDMIARQIPEFKRMGMGGFHVHVRVGLRNRYLGGEFLDLVHFSAEEAKRNGMLCWLYDEDRYASGIAGGEVTKTVAFRARWLKLSTARDPEMEPDYETFVRRQARNERVRGCFLGAYDIVTEDGWLRKGTRIGADGTPEGVKWYLYLELARETPWCNYQTYADTLNPDATRRFIALTHEKYAEILGTEFGKTVPAIFTDEPHFMGLRLPERADSREDILLPFTEALPELYGTVNGRDFFEALPLLVWNRRGEAACPERYAYYRLLSERFAEAYCEPVGRWCVEHGLLFTGHLLSEDTLEGQAAAVGEAMRAYRAFGIPGIDNLCDHRDFMAARQAASAANQDGREGVMSEEYGVTQWDFPFPGYKLAGDWQAALGVTLRVPHLAWASMGGEAKRDYPAAIGWQSPWYRDFRVLEDHFARVAYCMTRGRPAVRVGVLHPVESFWLLEGPADKCAGRMRQMEEDFRHLTEDLLTGGIDFDFIAESRLAAEEREPADGRLPCGCMAYEAVLVPECLNLRGSTVARLTRLAEAGGTVIFAGKPPCRMDCGENEALERLIRMSRHTETGREDLLQALGPWREIDLREENGKRTRNLLARLREEGDGRWLFIAQAYRGMEGRAENIWSWRAEHAPQGLRIRIRGSWRVSLCDTMTGEISPLPAARAGGGTEIRRALYGHDSLLLRLEPADGPETASAGGTEAAAGFPPETAGTPVPLPEPAEYRMSEPNALLLDRFEYALDGEPLQPAEEVLRLDNRLRERLGLPLRCEALAQPYVRTPEERREHTLRLRTVFRSRVRAEGCLLALEDAAYTRGTLNGEPIETEPCGYYVDEAIATVRLPAVREGLNELCLTVAYGDSANPERMYILGDFGVDLRGAHTEMTEKPERLYWGDYTRQGFPFYTGNMTCLVRVDGIRGRAAVQIPYYAGAAVRARLNGGEEQLPAFLPNTAEFSGWTGSGDLLEITLLGNRYNGFGQLHCIGDDLTWPGPNAWRTEGTSWTDTFAVRPMGVLTAPLVLKKT